MRPTQCWPRRGTSRLIVPDYSSRVAGADEVGVHRYDGEDWETWTGAEAARRLFIRRWL